ncbi:hypothetical protein B0A55_12913 [Friedmanniomyces simplex]|uniref:Carboxymuconolactone decarboxylase-like domain-containing protein n=1 Tax=Friedmanniomyces simplex TaxID=329884 RepID=A0A4U0VQ86_9PEZI|nr:hypothetical protein B0A55_12913 [Friedmanniomyces simplex]
MPYYSVHKRPPPHPLTPSQEKLKAALLATGEEWTPTWHHLLILDPTYFAAYCRLRSVPVLHQRLPRKTQHLVLLALDASVTHLHDHGIRVHTAAAMRAGASKEEIMETLELVSVLGVHAVTVGVPLLQEVLAERGEASDPAATALTPHQEQLKQDFTRQRGYYSSTWDPVLALSPDFFAAYTAFSSVPFQSPSHNHLEPKVKELIFVAIDSATTHLYAPGLKVHIRNAMQLGATREEVMEVFELAAGMGVVSVLRGVDALGEEVGGAVEGGKK